MSHYHVMVLTKDPDNFNKIMAPYSEVDEKYFQDIPVDYTFTELFGRYKPYKDEYDTFEQFLNEEYGYTMNGDYEIIARRNPNAKYDYYMEEQPENEWLLMNSKDFPHDYINCYKLKDFEFAYNFKDYEAYDRAIERWKDFSANGDGFHNKFYYLDKFEDAEHYAEYMADTFPLWALVTEDEWIEPGEVGWFATDSSTRETQIKSRNRIREIISNPEYREYYCVFLDCHI